MTPALRDVVASRDALRQYRRGYHLALVIARERGHTDEEIAQALDTKAPYVANAIRKHREGTCGCS